MTPERRGDWLVLALGVLASLAMGAYLAVGLQVTTDISHLLPSVQDKRLGEVARALAESELTRTMILTVGAPDIGTAKAAAAELAAELAKLPEVAVAQAGPDPGLAQAFWDLYQPRRLGFASEQPEVELPTQLSESSLRLAAQDLKRQLALPTAPLVKKVAPGDPLMIVPRLLRRLEAAGAGGVQVDGESFVSVDGKRAVILVALRHSALDAGYQAPLLQAIDDTFGALNTRRGGRVDLQQSGINRFAVQSRRSIEADVGRISTVSTVAMVALFGLLLRSAWLIFVAQLPITFALLCGATATQLVFGEVHGLTLAFGSTLIGVCIDYPVHFLNHHTLDPHPQGPKAGLTQIWTGLWLGAATTVAGFVGLGWSSYPGIRGVAVFASVGVTASVLATRWFLPRLVPRQPKPVALQQWSAGRMELGLEFLRGHRSVLVAMLVAAIGVAAAGLPRLSWNDDLAALNALDPHLKAEDDQVRAQVASLEPGTVVVVTAPDWQTALERNDEVALRLERAVQRGDVAHVRSLHAFLWSARLQSRNQARLRDDRELPARLENAFAAEGLRPGAFAPFAELLRGAPAQPLQWSDLASSPAGPLVRAFRTQVAGEPAVLTFLAGVRNPEGIATAIAGVAGALFFDQRTFVNKAYAEYRATTWTLVLAGIGLILLLIVARYRSWRLVAVSSVPALVACAATLGLLSLLGESLNLLHLVGFVIVLSIGVDYGVYLAETAGHPQGEPATVLSIVVASLSAVLAFGLLGLSGNPAMRAIGLTTGLGVLLSLLLAPTLLLLLRPGTPETTHDE